MKKILQPALIFIISNFVGVFIAYLLKPDNGGTFDFPTGIIYSTSLMWKTFTFIFTNNIIVFIFCFFMLRVLFYIKNKAYKDKVVYNKVDIFLYHTINYVFLIKTGVVLGHMIADLSFSTNVTILELYLKGIIPHRVIEMIPFFVIFYLNYNLISKRKWFNSMKFSKKGFVVLSSMILLAAIIESTVTPYVLYNL